MRPRGFGLSSETADRVRLIVVKFPAAIEKKMFGFMLQNYILYSVYLYRTQCYFAVDFHYTEIIHSDAIRELIWNLTCTIEYFDIRFCV